MSKRILIVTQYIYPETFRSTELAFELANRGYVVDVLCGIPNYPDGHYYDGYGLFSKRIENKDGVKFYRCFQTPRKLFPGIIGLSVNYVTFAICAIFWVFFYFAWKKRYDAMITHEPSPITQLIPAIILGKIRNVKVYSWIMDIWPDSVVSSVGNKKGVRFLKKLLNVVTNWTYRGSDKLLITSKGMAELINRDADYSHKIIYYPNWSDDLKKMPIEEIPVLPNGYKIMMAGNIADGLGIDSLVALLDEMNDTPEVKFIFVGGGNLQKQMEDGCKRKKLNNVYFMGKQPFSKMPAFYAKADAMLLTLKTTTLPHLDVTVPARLQGYMAGGKPVLAMIGKGASDLINEADCGYAVPAGEYNALAVYIKNTILKNRDAFAKKGENGRMYYEQHFMKGECITNLEKIIFG